ncbi:MAG: AEC family transporter [Gammaproteobacteria bacterium]|nr:AEC family transporter [Gammaproteobacteria bacterium]
MSLVLSLLLKLVPLYCTIALGWIAARYLEASGRHIAGIMLYIITPSVIFSGVMQAELTPARLLLPFGVWFLCIVLSTLFLTLGKRLLGDNRANILALAIATGNTGYFGIPVALLLFGPDILGLYILCMLGTTLHENSVGFYIAARGRYPIRECLFRVLRLPSLYAFLLAAALNMAGQGIPTLFQPWFDSLRGAYSVFGMMIIGMGISGFRNLAGDWRFTGLTFLGKFLVWPALALLLWQVRLGGYDDSVYRCLFLVSITPVAANTVVIATLLDTHTRQVAGTTLLSTLFALIWIPLMVAWVL